MFKIIPVILLSLWILYIGWRYYRTKELFPLLIAIGAIGVLIIAGIVGNITRPVILLWITQLASIIIATLGTIIALHTKRYKLLYILILPFIPIVLFLTLEALVGSGGGN